MLGSPDTGLAVLVGIIPAVICFLIVIRDKTDREFLLRLFIVALALRWMLAFYISINHQQAFFGGDAATFNTVGKVLSSAWNGEGYDYRIWLASHTNIQRSGWGMSYYVGAVYYLLGTNQLAVQLINCAFGAASCVVVYKIASIIYPERRVARTAALLTAFSPSMIMWSSQMMKDGPIVLCLCLCTLYALKLRNRVEFQSLAILLISFTWDAV